MAKTEQLVCKSLCWEPPPPQVHQHSPDNQGLLPHTELSLCSIAPLPALEPGVSPQAAGHKSDPPQAGSSNAQSQETPGRPSSRPHSASSVRPEIPTPAPPPALPALGLTLMLDQSPFFSHTPATQVKLWEQRQLLPP